jgi:EAL domain-containing protein (putative c-di-GMP-specific phosphodiesterase class I)
MHEASARLVKWQRNPETACLTLSVNVSARQFRKTNFVEEIRRLIETSGANPELLKFEITESLLLEDVETIIEKMTAIKELGVTFSLDDFGTGYSSLSYVKRLPIDQLKIDQSFVRDILIDQNDAAICRAIIALGQSLGLNIIAEGVETAFQWNFLRLENCRQAQGYYFAKPMPAEEFIAWMEKKMPARRVYAKPTTTMVH